MKVVVLNLSTHDALFAPVRAVPGVQVVHARYQTSWEEVSARRRGAPTEPEVLGDDLRATLAEAEIVVGFAVPRALPSLAPHLKWVASIATGMDHLRGSGVLEADILLTNVGATFAPVLAEHVFAAMLYLAKRLPELTAQQRAHTWKMAQVGVLDGKTMGLVGIGRIGSAVATRAKAFGMSTIGLGRSPAVGRVVAGVDRIVERHALPALLEASDYVVLALADTTETQQLIGAPELATMQAHTVLVNVGRGSAIDQSALAAALQAGKLGGAALDVFAEEPLVATSPLWDLPNVLITPHVAAYADEYVPRAVRHFTANLSRFLRGEPLVDLFDRTRGY